ncbi:MAG: hypothetical protein J5999_09340 [Oscillospiraceae bacterium]|nr:hypothetical protein [Oscillospiraceae bacterium]
MSLLESIFKKACVSNEDIALELFESENVGGNVSSEAKRILKSCSGRQEVLLKAIELCGSEPDTPKKLYIVSHCYVYLGAAYRKQAIKYLEEYILKGAVWEGTPAARIREDGYILDQLKANQASVYSYLGKAYEGEYEFEKAETAYKSAESLAPYFAAYAVQTAETYIKRNNLQTALNYLEKYKKSTYYKKNVNDYKLLLDNAISDINSKISKGYVYRPRKKSEEV